MSQFEKGKMPSLKDRKWVCPRMCSHCINCFCIEVASDKGVTDEYFCLVGLSKEELAIITKELGDNHYGMFTENHEYSAEFKKVMGAEDLDTIFDSSRYVFNDDCCNLFGIKMGAENEDC